jgi:hypothetical protein
MAKSPYFQLQDLRGGVNDSDSPFAIAENQVVSALNVDFREGMLGTKRGGLSPLALTNSIFSRDLPQLQVTNQGGWTVAAGGTLAISAGANTDGTGATNHMLIVRLVTTATMDVTAVDLSGNALTLLGEVSNGVAGRMEVWYRIAPAIGGGTLNVTLAGVADCAILAERWIYCDPVAPSNFASSTGGSVNAQPSSNAWNAQFVAQLGFAWDFSIGAASSVGPGVTTQNQQATGNARVLGASMVGMKPTSLFSVGMSGVTTWLAFVWGLRGRAVAMATTTTRIMTLMRHQPDNTLSHDELWAQDNFGRLDRYASGAWQTGVPMGSAAVGAMVGTDGSHHTNGVSLHGKFFIALDGVASTGDRLHVWTGSVLRFAGMVNNTGLSVANRAGAGTFATTRYYRVRIIEKSGTTILRRSEPTPTTIFVPGGANSGATITKGVTPGFFGTEGETDWELEASIDNVLFYRIGTVSLGTGTQDDTAAYAGAATYSTFPLSENIGEYTVSYAPRHVAVDQDRLLMAGSQLTPVLDSRVQWSVLRADLGVGNDERVPITSRFFTDVDALRGGALTYMSSGMSGAVYLFKLQQIHKLVRTGGATKAYDTHIETEQRGATYRGAEQGFDENGQPAVYFMDSNVGLCRFGVNGVQDLSQVRRKLMQRLNKAAGVVARIVFYPKHWLVWVALSLDGATTPSQVCCFNIRTNGWTDYTGTAGTWAGGVVYPNLTTLELRPYVAPATNLGTSLVCEADNGVDDDGNKFRGVITSRPYQLGQLFLKFALQGAVLMGRAGTYSQSLGLVRDYGLARKDTEVKSFAATLTETSVVVGFDDATMGECKVVQFELGDPPAYAGAQLNQTWTLDEFAAKYALAEETVGS